MTKQRPASLKGSLLVKKGQAKPSVAPTTDPVAKKVSRFPDPESIGDSPLISTPPIADLYGIAKEEPIIPDGQPLVTAAPAARNQPPVTAPPETENQTPLSAPRVDQDDRAVAPVENDPAPEPRLVVLLPRPSVKVILSALLIAVMGVSAWYLLNSTENTGTQRLASVGPVEEATTPSALSGPAASAISPPPSGINAAPATPSASEQSKGSSPGGTAETTSAQPASTATASAPPVPEAKPKQSAASSASDPQYAIQLLATKSTEAGRAAWAQISKKHSQQLNGLTLDLQTVTLQGRGKFVRVRAGPIDQKQVAVNRCKALSSAGQDCLVVKF